MKNPLNWFLSLIEEWEGEPSFKDKEKTLLYVALSGVICIIAFYRMKRFGDTTIVQPELELQSLEELRKTLVATLELSITNIGESLPTGHTWDELAQEMHKGSEDKDFLISLISV